MGTNEENKGNTRPNDKAEETSSKFGRVIDVLHSKSKLPSLRTYQGDMAEFIKKKDESVISIAIKEKERKEEKEKIKIPLKQDKKNFSANLVIISLSILLIAGGVLASFYLLKFVQKKPASEVVIKTEIIPYNNLITLTGVTKENLKSELAKLSLINGINAIEIHGADNLPLQNAKDFFAFLEVRLPGALERTLGDRYVFGIISQNKENSSFVVITVDDFGNAFSSMLDWEKSMAEDLSFLSPEENLPMNIDFAATSTESVASTTADVKIPLKIDSFSWKDVIIKNKDTRGLINKSNQTRIAYTFLDKNTILITNSISAIGDISSAYVSRSVAR